jgi:hypothetical protein
MDTSRARSPRGDLERSRSAGVEAERPAPHGVEALIATLVAIGVVLLGIQLWLLTVALDIYLAGNRGDLWVLAVLSGIVFLGGLAAVRLIGRLARMGRHR